MALYAACGLQDKATCTPQRFKKNIYMTTHMYKKTQVTNVSIPLWEGNFRAHCDFTLASFNGHHTSTQASSFAIHLDAFVQELLLWVQHEGLNYSVQFIKEGTFWLSQKMFVQHTLYNTDVHSQSASIDTTTRYFDSVWKKKNSHRSNWWADCLAGM